MSNDINETPSAMVLYLCASLNGILMEAVRTSSRPRAISEYGSAEQETQGTPQSQEVWNQVQAALTNDRERRLAYLLYHCGLQPAEIVQSCPQEWSDIHEVTRLRHVIFVQLMKSLPWA